MEEIRDEAKKHLGGCQFTCENWMKNVNDDVINKFLINLNENSQKFSSFSKVITMAKELQDLSEFCRDLQLELEKIEKTNIENSQEKKNLQYNLGVLEHEKKQSEDRLQNIKQKFDSSETEKLEFQNKIANSEGQIKKNLEQQLQNFKDQFEKSKKESEKIEELIMQKKNWRNRKNKGSFNETRIAPTKIERTSIECYGTIEVYYCHISN